MLLFSSWSFLSAVPDFLYTPILLVLAWFIAAGVSDLYAKIRSERGETKPDFEYVGERAKQVVRVGQSIYSEMLDSVVDAALDSGVSKDEAAKILDQEIKTLKLEQKTWKKLTEVERLNAAFSELEMMGYHTGGGMVEDAAYEVSKANKAEKLAKKRSDKLLGYMFYRIEDVEEAFINDQPIYFWYGVSRSKSNEEEELRVVRDLNLALLSQGLKPVWDGTLKSQLNLPINWQVRWDETRDKAA